MKLEVSNPNYAATVVQVRNLVKLDGLDRCLGLPVFGCQAIVGLDTHVGDLGIVFLSETQLSDEFCRNNNLYRDKELNVDDSKAGYFEDNRRVKAIKFKGNRSSAFFTHLDSLSYLGIDLSTLKEGDTFTSIDGREICRKFVRREAPARGNKVRNPQQSLVDSRLFPEHLDTENYWKNEHKIAEHEYVIITQKLHGTSARFTKQAVERKLTFWERMAQKVGLRIADREYKTFAGTRRTVIDTNEQTERFYATDVWSLWYTRIQHLIPKNWVIYGEIIGWAGQSPIQGGYTYNVPKGESEFYVYRIAVVNEDGFSVDLSWDAVKQWCNANGLNHVPELFLGVKLAIDIEVYMDLQLRGLFANAIPLCDESPCDEGVCVRAEGVTPYILKAKSPKFLEFETRGHDKGNIDLEEAVSAE